MTADPLEADTAKYQGMWQQLIGAAEAAVALAAEVDHDLLYLGGGFDRARGKLRAALDGGYLGEIEDAARALQALATFTPGAIGRPGMSQAEVAFQGAIEMLRGCLHDFDAERARVLPSEGRALTDDPASCAWCGTGDPPVCYFPVEEYEITSPRVPAPFRSGTRMYACAACKLLVEGYQWRALAARNGLPWPAPTLVASMWLAFKGNRTGPAVDLPAQQEADRGVT